MTTAPRQLEYRSFRAPRENGAVLVDPPLAEVPETVQRNVELRRKCDAHLCGRPLRELAEQARSELLEGARRWVSAYRDITWSSACRAEWIFLAGHQPQLFHPGVWLKNFALGMLAKQHGAVPVNLIIDSDTAKSVALRVPGGSAARPQVGMIPFDKPQAKVPYEERPIADRELFAAFGRRVAGRIRPLVPDPLVNSFWPMVLQQLQTTDNLGCCLARARHELEGQWGLQTLEIPQSWICGSQSFCWLVAHLLAELPRFWSLHNDVLGRYRQVHHIRNAAQPVPDLAADGQWLEAPLWVWTAEAPQRRRLFARRHGSDILLSDRDAWQTSVPLPRSENAQRTIDRLSELGREGVKIRSRALVTTLWARLALGDLFLHGIGGAKYDQVTDSLIERFFGLTPPRFMVVSATLHLPVESPEVAAEQIQSVERELRELQYHPERYLDRTQQPDRTEGIAAAAPDEITSLVAQKQQWIHTPATSQNARARWTAIRQINEALQPAVAAHREALQTRQTHISRALTVKEILQWREYAFCLYPENTLRQFIERSLPSLQ